MLIRGLLLFSLVFGGCSAPSEAEALDESREVSEETSRVSDTDLDNTSPEATELSQTEESSEETHDEVVEEGVCSRYITEPSVCANHFPGSPWGWSGYSDCCRCLFGDCGAPCNTELNCIGRCADCETYPYLCAHFDESEGIGFCTPADTPLPGCYDYYDGKGEPYHICSG